VTRSVSSARACSLVRVIKFARRSARTNGPITCCDFGIDRLEKFPGADFCHPCKLWDDRDVLNSRISRSSRRYACKRTHETLFKPQQRAVQWWDGRKTSVTPPSSSGVAAVSGSKSPERCNNRKWQHAYTRKYYQLRKDMGEQLNDAFQESNHLHQKLGDVQKLCREVSYRFEEDKKEVKKHGRANQAAKATYAN
jgi:hypothetical protein